MDFSTYTPEQKRSVQHLEGPLLISAGAGSGKTFTLTQRITWALLPGSGTNGQAFLNSIDEALVITFTEKAAAEIKDRIRSTLRFEGMLEEALKVDAAWVSTIHGMCSRILREHALEIGLDPEFSILSATQEEELRMLAIEDVLKRNEGQSGVYHALFNLFKVQDLKEALENVLKNAHTLPAGLSAVHLGPTGTPLETQARSLLEMALNPPRNATEKAAAVFQSFAEQLPAFLKDPSNINMLADILHTQLGSGNATKEFNAAVMRMRNEVVTTPYRTQAESFMKLTHEVEAEYEHYLETSGQVDMAGLIRKTLSVFTTYPEIAELYTQRFKLIMVDEFQDTSQLQIDMIEKIAGPTKQRLCTVGDAQQSIYRFQGADVSVYLRHKQEMHDVGAKVVQLNDNFRSNADILAFVRRICGQEGYFPETFLDLKAAKEGKPFKGGGPRIELSLIPYSTYYAAPVKAKEARAAEATHIAKRFAQLHEEGHNYSEMVLLLGRMSWAHVYAKAIREVGLPCIVAGGSRYFESDHVKTCLALLATLANPYDSTSLLSVLTSEALPVSTNDLLYLATTKNSEGKLWRQHIANGLLLADALPRHASPLLVHAQSVLAHAWQKLGRVRPAQLFKETLVESGWLGRLEGGTAHEQAQAADVLKFVRLIEETQQSIGFDMVQVTQEMNNRSQVAGEKPGALSVENLDAIRIMTIHASKGLEFPIVAIADCYETRSSSSKASTHAENGTLYLSLAGPGFKAGKTEYTDSIASATEPGEFRSHILNTTKEREYEEKKRLFYVAATRASAALLVGLCVPKSKESGYPRLVEDIKTALLPDESDFPESDTLIDYGGSSPLQFSVLHAAEPEVSSSRDAAHADHISIPTVSERQAIQLVPSSTRTGFFSYSSLAGEKQSLSQNERGELHTNSNEQGAKGYREHVLFVDDDIGGTEETVLAHHVNDADAATCFGSALHRACEWLAFQQGEPADAAIAAALERAAKEFAVADHTRLEQAFNRWRTSEVRSWTRSFESQQPELPFVVEKDGGILEGEIDLFCATGTHAGIVDYKTGGHANETAEELYEKHLLQAQCYAYAALQAGFKQVELRFVRVEQEDPTQPGQPQVVSYHFSAGEL